MVRSLTRLVAFSIQHAILTTDVLHKNTNTKKWHKTSLFWLVKSSKKLETEINIKFEALTPELVKQGLLLEIDHSINVIRNNADLLFNNGNIDTLLCDNYSANLSYSESKKIESMML